MHTLSAFSKTLKPWRIKKSRIQLIALYKIGCHWISSWFYTNFGYRDMEIYNLGLFVAHTTKFKNIMKHPITFCQSNCVSNSHVVRLVTGLRCNLDKYFQLKSWWIVNLRHKVISITTPSNNCSTRRVRELLYVSVTKTSLKPVIGN